MRAARSCRGMNAPRRGRCQLAAAIPDPAERAFLVQNLVFENGQPRWRLNLAAIEREMPELVGFPELHRRIGLSWTGAVCRRRAFELFRAEDEPAIRRLFPAAEIVRIDGAGHWLHVEQPTAFLAAVEPFLAANV